MSKGKQIDKDSQQIKAFLDYVQRAKDQYTFCYENVNIEEKRTSDLLHKLELDEDGYKERAKIATQIKTAQQDRRYYKDRVEEYEPIINFLKDPNNKRMFDKLQQVLGQVRKAEDYHKNRTYYQRVLKGGA